MFYHPTAQMFFHPATEFTCRHCGKNIGHDTEWCFNCGPICDDCWVADDYPCESKKETSNKNDNEKTS